MRDLFEVRISVMLLHSPSKLPDDAEDERGRQQRLVDGRDDL